MKPQQSDPLVLPITLCAGAVVLRGNQVLLIRQAYGSLKGVWSLPWGFVDGRKPDGSLETPDSAALRETQEEAGITAQVEGLLGIQNHKNENGEPRLYLIYLCRHVSGEPVPDHYETDKAAYFSLGEMDNFNEPVDTFCAWIVHCVLEGNFHLIPTQPMNPYRPHLAFF